jgi:hypothetical protein
MSFTEKMRAAALGVEEALEMLRKRREEIRRADAERGKRAEEDSEEDGNGSLLSEGVVVGAGQPKVGSSHEVKLVSLNSAMKNNHNDGMVTVLEKEEEDDGKRTKKTKSSSVKMMMALRYTHERAPAADARKPVRVVRRKNNTTTNNNERGVVEIEFRNKEEEKSGIRYRGVTSTSGGGGGGGRATTKTKKKKKKSDGKEADDTDPADDADEDEDEDDEDDDNVECAILFDGKTIELRVLDETVAGLRVQRKREDEEESGIVSKRLDIGDAADVKNKRKKVNL